MTETTSALFAMRASGGKPVIAAFDGGAQTSDIGVALLAAVERRFGCKRGGAALCGEA
jgi:hypothetical protein